MSAGKPAPRRQPLPDYADELAGRTAGRNRSPSPRRVALFLAVVTAFLALVALWPAGAMVADGAGAPAKLSDRLPQLPVRVIDGDTIDVGGERIRLLDIDTPELRGRCDSETALARQAAARLTALIVGTRWVIHRVARRDRYGRTLATLYTTAADGTPVSIGQILVAEGLAVKWAGRRHDWCGRGE